MMLRMNTAAWCSHQNYYCTKKYNVGWDSLGIRVITLGIISDHAKDDAAQCNTFHRLRLINCVISAVSLSIFDDFYVIFQSYPAYACEPIKKQCDTQAFVDSTIQIFLPSSAAIVRRRAKVSLEKYVRIYILYTFL